MYKEKIYQNSFLNKLSTKDMCQKYEKMKLIEGGVIYKIIKG